MFLIVWKEKYEPTSSRVIEGSSITLLDDRIEFPYDGIRIKVSYDELIKLEFLKEN